MQILNGRPLLEQVVEAIRPQCSEILISANDLPADRRHDDLPIVPDRTAGFAGPLAGLQAGMLHARYDLVASVPCDAPFLPHDLIARLHAAMETEVNVAIVKAAGRIEPAFALYRRRVQLLLDDYLASGGRKLKDWQDTLKPVLVEFSDQSAFFNINTAEDLTIAEQNIRTGKLSAKHS